MLDKRQKGIDMIKLSNSVGLKGKNLEKDVKRIQALINVYRRANSEEALAVSGKNSTELENAIASFQKDHMKLKITTSKVEATSGTLTSLKKYLSSIFKPVAIVAPTYGEVTWNSEGAEGGKFHSRLLTVPTNSSGLTIGRGYDMKEKLQSKIVTNMTTAGIPSKNIDVIKKAAGLSGTTAEWFIIENDLLDFQVTTDQQKALFKISYDEESDQVKKICKKSDVIEAYGETDWDKLNSAIKGITVDLKFRGDYTGSARKLIQKSIADNDFSEFKKKLKDKTNWSNVPQDRFDRRVAYLDKQVEPAKVTGTKPK